MRSGQDKANHDNLVRAVISRMKQAGYTIRSADLPEHSQKPGQYGDHQPDVEARDWVGQTVLGEVELCSDIGRDHPTSQMRAFGRHYKLILGVPTTCVNEARNWVSRESAQRNLNVEVWGL